MTRILRALGLLVAMALLQAYAPAKPPPPLSPPIKAWGLDYGDTACTASRTYGKAEAPAILAFRPSPNGKVVRMTLIRPGQLDGPVQLPLATNITAKAGSALRFPSNDKTREIVWVNFERADLARLPAAGELSLSGNRFVDSRFALPGIADVLAALDTCNADLRRHWNVDQAGVKLSTPATPLKPLFQYFSADDYPDAAIKQDAGGISVVMMMIDESGAAKDCLVEQSSGVASLDATTCVRILERAKFKPALDTAGKPVRSVLTTRVVWKISEEW